MTPEQLERAARYWCEQKGQNPDDSVIAVRNETEWTRPRWQEVASHLEEQWRMMDAINHGLDKK